MDARQYADEIVAPTIDEFECEPRSLRRCFLAHVVTYHMIDYMYPDANQRKLQREAFRSESPSFNTIDRVAHGFKHGDTKDKGLQPPLSSSQVIERPPAFAGTAVVGLSRCADTVGGVTIFGEQWDRGLLIDVKLAAAFLRMKGGI